MHLDGDEILVDPDDYDNITCQQFVRECQDAGLDVEHYHGRFYWEGPAVRADYLSDVMSVTGVRCQSDSMGLGVIVYPEVSCPLTDHADREERQIRQAQEENEYWEKG